MQEFSLMDHRGYKSAQDRLVELQTDLQQVEADIREINSNVSERYKALKEKRVQALLDRKNPDDIKSDEYFDSLAKARDRKQLIVAAIDKQKKVVDQERKNSSLEMLKIAGPQYRETVRKLALEYIKLAERAVEEIDLRTNIVDSGCYISHGPNGIRPMPVGIGDDPRNLNSNFSMYIQECVEYGFLRKSDVPKMFKDAWYKRHGFSFEINPLARVVPTLR